MAAIELSTDNAAKRASGSSFYIGMRLLPPPQRAAVFEIYSFCRAVDDVADDPGPRETRLAQLQQWRADVDALFAGTPPPRLRGLSGPVRDFALNREDFHAIIDGMEMDVTADIRAPDWATLDLYCDRVASAVGRLCVRVFGMGRTDGIELAYHLGRALQLTNILRDLDEDSGISRLYLPREALTQSGITASEPASVLYHPNIGQACAMVVERARNHFVHADEIMTRSPRRLVRTPKVMGEVYKLKLDGLVARGFAPPRPPVRVSRLQLLWILARYAVI
ncbi:MAG TPA: presqualene diphosphate synthase HpnD [Pseudorhodoplanes sp.]|nr:presqualene diphosphate synthase HpnD [Pseudorhodoplanes sp.]